VTILQYVGVFLVVVGIGEFFVFRHLARTQESIARRRTLLNANSSLNVIVGLVLLIFGGR
jgi:uncharacterized membrane protein YidH (DUF202 family)